MTGAGSSSVRPAAVRATGWGWRHGGRAACAIQDLDLTIDAGERVLLLGASGSGKSTLLAALAGVLGGDDEGDERGSLTIDGVAARDARGRAGLVLQDPETQVILPRIGDDVAFGCENLAVARDEIWHRVRGALDLVGLDLPLDASTTALSGGQKQRLALAGVLAMRPGLVLLDEPTANLDPDGARRVRAAVDRAVAATGATLVVVEHRVQPWLDLIDRVIVLGDDGRLVADGAPDAVFAAHGASLAARGVWVPGADAPPSLAAQPSDSRARTPLLRASGLVVGRGRRPACAIAALTVHSGELLAVSGPNGAGKSTLALTLGALLPPVAGDLAAAPELARGLGPAPIRWRSRELLTRIGSVFQSPQHQFIRPTVRAELGVGLRAVGMPEHRRSARVVELLDRLGLAAVAEANPFTLSGGQQRRLSVGGVLAAAPALVVVDEPTFGQDALTWRSVVDLLLEAVAGGTAVVAASHDDLLLAAAGAHLRLGEQHRVAA